jgi:hypothetical protein
MVSTPDLFCLEPLPLIGGSLNYSLELRHVLTAAIKRSAHSRQAIAQRMSELAGEEITKAQLDAWTAESRALWRFPFAYAAGFEAACECNDLQELLARKRGSRVLTGNDILYAELGRIAKQRAEFDEREDLVKRQLRAHKA